MARFKDNSNRFDKSNEKCACIQIDRIHLDYEYNKTFIFDIVIFEVFSNDLFNTKDAYTHYNEEIRYNIKHNLIDSIIII